MVPIFYFIPRPYARGYAYHVNPIAETILCQEYLDVIQSRSRIIDLALKPNVTEISNMKDRLYFGHGLYVHVNKISSHNASASDMTLWGKFKEIPNPKRNLNPFVCEAEVFN